MKLKLLVVHRDGTKETLQLAEGTWQIIPSPPYYNLLVGETIVHYFNIEDGTYDGWLRDTKQPPQ